MVDAVNPGAARAMRPDADDVLRGVPMALYLQDAHPIREAMGFARRAEELGFSAVWQADSRLVREATVPMAAIAATTERIAVGSGVIDIWTRNPARLASLFSTLDDLAPGRILAGLGAWWDPLAARVGVARDRPLRAMREVLESVRALLVCDAVQAAGKMPIAGADLIAISAHKFHGPKGVGALWVRDGVDLQPLVTGGGQEDGLRSGTLSPALCAGMGAAAKSALERMEADARHVAALWTRARDLFAGWEVNGSAETRWLGNFNIRREGLDVARLMSDLREVMFSAGSACASEAGKPSRILGAIGLTPEQARGSVRIGFGRYTTLDELERAAEMIIHAASQQG